MYGCAPAQTLQSCPTLCDPTNCSPLGSSVHGDSPGKNTGGLPCPPPGDLLHPGIKPTSPVGFALQADSLPLSHWRSPKCVCVCVCVCVAFAQKFQDELLDQP